MEYNPSYSVPFDDIVPAPPSIGTDVPIDLTSYRLKAYPYYDAPNPPQFVERLLKDRGVIPDTPINASQNEIDNEQKNNLDYTNDKNDILNNNSDNSHDYKTTR